MEIDYASVPAVLAVTIVTVTLVVTGPAVGAVGSQPAERTGTLGDGDATVHTVTFDDEPRITPGRFGSGARYLRVPALEATVGAVTGRPRLVYVFAVPELGFERVGTALLDDAGRSTVTVEMSDRAFDPDRIENDSYRATVTVRVQSFTTDRILRRQNVTVEVVR